MNFGSLAVLLAFKALYSGAEWISADDFMYFFSPHEEIYSYFEAISRCFEMEANLTSIRTEDEHSYLVTHMTKSNYWIGLWLQDAGVECDACSALFLPDEATPDCIECRKMWTWRDGSAMVNANNELVLDKWLFSEPTGGQNCARLSTEDGSQGYWKDTSCQQQYGFICKKVNDRTTLPSTSIPSSLSQAFDLSTTPLTSTTVNQPKLTSSNYNEDKESTSLTVALVAALVTGVCLILLVGAFVTTCCIYSQRAKRKRYEVEKARLHLEAISRQTSNWNVSTNGPVTSISPTQNYMLQQNVHYHNSHYDYEVPVTIASSYSIASVEPLTSFMTPAPRLPNDTPPSKTATPRSVRSVSASVHSTPRTARNTPPLMCSTPGSMRNEPLGFSASLLFENASQSVCSTPLSIRSTQKSIHSPAESINTTQDSIESEPWVIRDPEYWDVRVIPDPEYADVRVLHEPDHTDTGKIRDPEYSDIDDSFTRRIPNEHNHSNFHLEPETVVSVHSTPLSIRKHSLDNPVNEEYSSQEKLDKLFDVFDNIANDNFEFENNISDPEFTTCPDQYSVSSFEMTGRDVENKRRHNPGVFYLS